MKMRATLTLMSVVAAGGIVVGAAFAAGQVGRDTGKSITLQAVPATGDTKVEIGKDVKCPISGKEVNPNATVDFEECKVYLCCDKCPAAWEKDKNHAKYGAKAHHQMVQTGQLKQVACPFTGKPVNSEMAVEIEGVKVEFCCDKCKGKVEKAKDDVRVGMVFKDTSKGFKLAKDVEKKEEKK